MTFDALTLAAVRDELQTELLRGQVQRVVLTGELCLGLEIYARGRRQFLLCSAEPLAARVCLTAERPLRQTERPTPFLLLLRKHARNGRVVAIQQPAYERILRLRINKRDKENIPVEIDLIIEVMGRRSNVLMVGSDGRILEALRRVGPTRNRIRSILPGRLYEAPPAQDRLDPLDPATYERLKLEFASEAVRPEELLAGRLAGFSPLLAREAAFRALGELSRDSSPIDWTAVRTAVDELLAPMSSGQWEPTVALRDGQVVAFAPYPITHIPGVKLHPAPSISRAVELGLTQLVANRPAAGASPDLLAAIDRLRQRTERKLTALRRSLAASQRARDLREDAEAVLANVSLIEADQTTLSFNGREIQLETELTALENAERLFRDYRKARDAAEQLPGLLAAAELRLRHLEELRVMAELADSLQCQRALREELAELAGEVVPERAVGKQASRRRGPGAQERGGVLRDRTPDGLEVLIGASGRGNEAVTFRLGRPDDLWLHARGTPGAHVLLRTDGREPPHSSLLHAAKLAAQNSRARAAGRAEVDYTSRKHVRKIPGSAPGLVTYSAERTIAVETD